MKKRRTKECASRGAFFLFVNALPICLSESVGISTKQEEGGALHLVFRTRVYIIYIMGRKMPTRTETENSPILLCRMRCHTAPDRHAQYFSPSVIPTSRKSGALDAIPDQIYSTPFSPTQTTSNDRILTNVVSAPLS